MNILLIQLRRIGDLILTTPAIAAIRQKFPDAHITLVTSRSCAPLLPAIPHLDSRYVMQRNPADVGTFMKIARTKFDACVDFTRNNRSALLSYLSHAKIRIASARIKRRAPVRQRAYNQFVPGRVRDAHMIDYNLSLLKPLGIQDTCPPVQLIVPAESAAHAKDVRHRSGITEPFVIFHPGSARIEKFWQPDRWANLIQSALERWPVTCVLTGGSSPQEKSHLAEIESLLPRPSGDTRPRVVDLSNKIDLLTLTALIAQARLLVTVDSAPVHLAAATKTPQIILFGPTNPFHWRPRHDSAVILQGGSPAPVRDFVPRQERLPMKLISTEAVIDAMNSLLSMPRP
ncbi:MAG TPA: putative lipopolysaccharide heptosyltransferase III [Chthoniobacterales bacterium]|nr:putative lipopolysaccharide heptosyltransferase III [Chthoniobacterales bacterium]